MTGAGVRATALAAWRGVHWYLREVSGESRWDDYVRQCEQHGHTPISRREFERRRTEVVERTPLSRCC